MPLYVRAGTILPLGPVKQYTSEVVDGPLTLQIYPGADGQFMVYEDDGDFVRVIAPATGWASTCAGTTRPSGFRSSSPRARACVPHSSASSSCD